MTRQRGFWEWLRVKSREKVMSPSFKINMEFAISMVFVVPFLVFIILGTIEVNFNFLALGGAFFVGFMGLLLHAIYLDDEPTISESEKS